MSNKPEYTKEEFTAYLSGVTACKAGHMPVPYEKLKPKIKRLWIAGYNAMVHEKRLMEQFTHNN